MTPRKKKPNARFRWFWGWNGWSLTVSGLLVALGAVGSIAMDLGSAVSQRDARIGALSRELDQARDRAHRAEMAFLRMQTLADDWQTQHNRLFEAMARKGCLDSFEVKP